MPELLTAEQAFGVPTEDEAFPLPSEEQAFGPDPDKPQPYPQGEPIPLRMDLLERSWPGSPLYGVPMTPEQLAANNFAAEQQFAQTQQRTDPTTGVLFGGTQPDRTLPPAPDMTGAAEAQVLQPGPEIVQPRAPYSAAPEMLGGAQQISPEPAEVPGATTPLVQLPHLSPEMEQWLQTPSEHPFAPPNWLKYTLGAYEPLVGAAEFVESPVGIATALGQRLPAFAQRLISLGWAGALGSEVKPAAQVAGEAWALPGNEYAKMKSLANLVMTIGFATGAGAHAAKPLPTPVSEVARWLDDAAMADPRKLPLGIERPIEQTAAFPALKAIEHPTGKAPAPPGVPVEPGGPTPPPAPVGARPAGPVPEDVLPAPRAEQLELPLDQIEAGPRVSSSNFDPLMDEPAVSWGRQLFETVKDYAQWSAQMLQRFGEGIRDKLAAMFDHIARGISKAGDIAASLPGARPERGGERTGEDIRFGMGQFFDPEFWVKRGVPEQQARDIWRRLGTRVPWSTDKKLMGTLESPVAEDLTIGAKLLLERKPQEIVAVLRHDMPEAFAGRGKLDEAGTVQAAIEHMSDNLVSLWQMFPKEWRDAAVDWYVGGRDMVEEMARTYGLEHHRGATVLAVLSPRTAWPLNAEMGKQLVFFIESGDNKRPWTPRMTEHVRTMDADTRAKIRKEFDALSTKEWDRLTGLQKAMRARVFAETYYSPDVPLLHPKEGVIGTALTMEGQPRILSWQSFDAIEKAINAIEGPYSAEMLSELLGLGHKVRSFSNNLLIPHDPRFGDATMDTHAGAAAVIKPLSLKSPQIKNLLGAKPSDAITGAQGTYGVFNEAYRHAARRVRVLPRALQSATWEALRALFDPAMKRAYIAARKKGVAPEDQIWQDVVRGKLDPEQARQKIYELATERKKGDHPFSIPEWAIPERRTKQLPGISRAVAVGAGRREYPAAAGRAVAGGLEGGQALREQPPAEGFRAAAGPGGLTPTRINYAEKTIRGSPAAVQRAAQRLLSTLDTRAEAARSGEIAGRGRPEQGRPPGSGEAQFREEPTQGLSGEGPGEISGREQRGGVVGRELPVEGVEPGPTPGPAEPGLPEAPGAAVAASQGELQRPAAASAERIASIERQRTVALRTLEQSARDSEGNPQSAQGTGALGQVRYHDGELDELQHPTDPAQLSQLRARRAQLQARYKRGPFQTERQPGARTGALRDFAEMRYLDGQIDTMLARAEQDARARIAERSQQTTFGSGPVHELGNIRDWAIVGTAKALKATMDAARWAREMEAELGPEVLPYLPQLWNQASQLRERLAPDLPPLSGQAPLENVRPAASQGPSFGPEAAKTAQTPVSGPEAAPAETPISEPGAGSVEPGAAPEAAAPAPSSRPIPELVPQQPGVTSLKNAVVDQERVARGEAPMMAPQARVWGEAWNRAMDELEQDPQLPDRLLAELQVRPRPLHDWENALLLQRRVELNNAFAKAARAGEEAFAAGDDHARLEASQRTAAIEDQLQVLEQATGKGGAGTETGRALAARKMMMNQDFSLANLTTQLRAAKGGAELTSQERASLVQLAKDWETKSGDFETKLKAAQEKLAELQSKAAHEQLKLDAGQEERVQTLAERITKGLQREADASRKYLAGKLFTLSPDVLYHLGRIGALEIARGAVKFTDWSARMLGEFGEKVRPHLQAVWEKSNELVDKAAGTAELARTVRRGVPDTLEDVRNKIAGAAAEGDTIGDMGPHAQKLARLYIGEGLKAGKKLTRDQVVDAVHKDLQAAFPGVTRSETRNAISGYGKFHEPSKEAVDVELRDIKGQLRQEEHLARMARGEPPLRTGQGRQEKSAEERRLEKLVNEAKRKGGYTVTDPARQLRSALQQQKTWLRHRMSDLRDEMAKRVRLIRKKTISPSDPELEQLRREYEQVKAEHKAMFPRQPLTDAQRLTIANRIADRQISQLESELNAGVLHRPKTKFASVDSPELTAKRAWLAALREHRQELRDIANPKLTPEQRANQSYRTRLAKRQAELESKMAAGDFSPKQQTRMVLEPESQRARAELERVKVKFEDMKEQARLAQRPMWEKVLDFVPQFKRAAVLSSVMVLPKLAAAAGWRALSWPIEDLGGTALRRLPGVRQVAQRAALEGRGLGSNFSATFNGYGKGLSSGLRDAWNVLKSGRSELDVLYGKPKMSYAGETAAGKVLEFPGRLHGFIKAPVKRAAFERSARILAESYARQGLDVTDPLVKTRIAVESYKAANAAIFLQDNFVATKVNQWLSKHRDKVTGRATVGSTLWSTVGRSELPVVKVPVNVVAELMEYIGGSVSGSLRLGLALKRGVQTLQPHEADLILRELKKGLVGPALMTLAYLNQVQTGGFYQPVKRQGPEDLKPGSVRIFGVDVSPKLLHSPLVMALQVGGTVKHVAESYLRKKDSAPQGLGAGLEAAALGVAEEVPFVKEVSSIDKAMNPYTRDQWKGDWARGHLVPQALQQLAQLTDRRPLQPAPSNFLQRLEVGIPGLRQRVPLENPGAWHLDKLMERFARGDDKERRVLAPYAIERLEKAAAAGRLDDRQARDYARVLLPYAPAGSE